MKELITRGLFGLVFLSIVFVPFIFDIQHNQHFFTLVLLLFSTLGTIELYRMSTHTAHPATSLVWALLTNAVLFLPALLLLFNGLFPASAIGLGWLMDGKLSISSYLWFIVLISSICFITLIYKKGDIAFIFRGTYLLSVFYLILPLAFLAWCLAVSEADEQKNLLFILLPIYLNDTLAYVSGRMFGKTKLFPSVSPKKTWEGLLGGVIGSIVVMNLVLVAIGGKNPDDHLIISILCILVSGFATFGDLFESKLKRSAGVKDSGKILPGHGGILDRIDAMLFTAPVLYLLLALIS